MHSQAFASSKLAPAYARVVRCTLLLAILGLGLACTRLPDQRFDLTRLRIVGNEALDDDEIEQHLASRETPRFLGLFAGIIYDYQAFNRFVLERDLQRIARLYRARGYYEANARAARVHRSGTKVQVKIIVEEGQPVLLRRVDVHGLDGLPVQLRERALAIVTKEMPLDVPFEEAAFQGAFDALADTLGDYGYAQAEIRKSASVNLPRRVAAAGFWIEAGQPAELGEATLTGLAGLPEAELRRTLALEPGMPFSRSDLVEAERALLELGVFSSVQIEPQLDQAHQGRNGRQRIPVLVRVEKAKLRSVHVGGGVMVDSLKSDVHLRVGWESRNFWGGLRKFQAELVPGAVIHPTRFPSFDAPERLLPQGRLRSEFRQPGFVEPRTNAVLKVQASIYPVLLTSERDPQSPILGYRDYRLSAGVERSFRKFYGYLSLNLQLNDPFTYVGDRDPALGRVLVSYPALLGALDLRDDKIQPHRGMQLSSELQVAGLGGDARDVRIQPELRAYIPLSRRWTLAARGSVGLLLPFNYGQTVNGNANRGDPGLSGEPLEARRAWVQDIQIMFMRGFFSGGSGSNRGYGPREIGPHGVIPFYNYGQSIGSPDVDCRTGSDSYQLAVCKVPLGGFTLWEASLELRYPLSGALNGTVFVDTSDVSPDKLSFRWDRPHLSVGAGLRYGTPVGPVRFDLGYRVPGLQAPADAMDEGRPTELFGLPVAASFGIGESF